MGYDHPDFVSERDGKILAAPERHLAGRWTV